MSSPILVLTTFPDIDTAQRMSREMVQAKLAACVNIAAAGQSIYMWEGKIFQETEHIAIIKTTDKCYPELESYIKTQHPYELPEIISTPITNGSKDYLDWLMNDLTNELTTKTTS
ncbi:MAG: divalent cation tolerance protein CutA [Gammaproteobacteria bacterium]|nr:MAG: divalent cation tolerance protein CutA [Gammaproteobacteria bacterium]